MFTFLNTVLFPLTGCYLVRHLCFRLLIIISCFLDYTSCADLLFNFSSPYFFFFFFVILLLTFLLFCQCFLPPSCPSYILAKNHLCRVKYKGPATVNDCSIIGVSAGRWWITLMTVLISVFVGPDCRWLAQSAVLELIASLKMQQLECDRRGFSMWAC